MAQVVVVGGGLAGLAAAASLARAGVAVTLLESRPSLGGRASSFLDAGSGATIDNCQHVTMGCCTNLAHFCRMTGVADAFSTLTSLWFVDASGRRSRIGAAPLPAPCHLIPSFLAARFLSLEDKLRIAWGMFRLMREPTAPPAWSFRDWLLKRKQTPRTCDRYWGVVLTSALNETLDRLDYGYARQVFLEGFLQHRRGGVVEVPKIPLGELYGNRLRRWLADHGVDVRTGTAAARLDVEAGRVVGCRLRNGAVVAGDNFILAVPFQRVADLLPAEVAQQPPFANLRKLEASPITSVHLWFDRPVMEESHLVVVGRTVQWLFRRETPATSALPLATETVAASGAGAAEREAPASIPGAQHGRQRLGASHYLQAVISASRDLAALSKDAVLERVIADLGAILPSARVATVTHARVVTERVATFSVTPGVDALRPPQATPMANLWLAGDYTQTGWPATMEGAVRSGFLCAEGILAALGHSEIILQKSLEPGLLARRLIRPPPVPSAPSEDPFGRRDGVAPSWVERNRLR